MMAESKGATRNECRNRRARLAVLVVAVLASLFAAGIFLAPALDGAGSPWGKVLRLDLAMVDILHEQSGRSAVPAKTRPVIMTEKELLALQKDNLLSALRLSNWRVSGPNGAAKLVGLKPTTFNDRIRKFGLQKPGRGAER